jgi:hypothetical protein
MRVADRIRPWLAPWSLRRTWFAWAASRALCVLLVAYPHLLGAQQDVLGDVHLYEVWGHGLVHGAGLPTGDSRWQYPPGAAVVLALPSAVAAVCGLSYLAGLVVLLLAVDAGLLAGLRRWRGPSAGRFWVIGLLALGPVAFARFDLVAAALAAAALYAVARRRLALAGVGLGLGGLVKIWPVVLVLPVVAYLLEQGVGGQPAGRSGTGAARSAGSSGWDGFRSRVRAAAGGVALLVAGLAGACVLLSVVLVAAGWWHGLASFLGAQSARGLQLEAVPAAPFVIGRVFGFGPAPTYTYGSLQFSADGARAVATACSIAQAAVVVFAGVWWLRAGWRRDPAGPSAGALAGAADDRMDRLVDRCLLLVLLLVVTSRVFSPQYLVWLLALAACRRPGHRPGNRWRAGALLLAAALLAQAIYPVRYNDVVQGRVVAGLLLVARDAVEVTACWCAWRAARPQAPPFAPVATPPRSLLQALPRRRRPRAPTGDVPAGAR